MSSIDEIIELYKKDIDITLLQENLKKTPDERIRFLEEFLDFQEELRSSRNRPGTCGPEGAD